MLLSPYGVWVANIMHVIYADTFDAIVPFRGGIFGYQYITNAGSCKGKTAGFPAVLLVCPERGPGAMPPGRRGYLKV